MPTEIIEVVQQTETLHVFTIADPSDEAQGPQAALQFFPIEMSSGTSPRAPTIRVRAKRRLDDPDAFALFDKYFPPYPSPTRRWGLGVPYNPEGNLYRTFGGIFYWHDKPWWYWFEADWPDAYSYDPTTPPTDWAADANDGTKDWLILGRGYDILGGETPVLFDRWDSWFPPGDYHGFIDAWKTGDGTPPDEPPTKSKPFILRILPRSSRS